MDGRQSLPVIAASNSFNSAVDRYRAHSTSMSVVGGVDGVDEKHRGSGESSVNVSNYIFGENDEK